ncbi:ATP-dependent sacrificial sulfur transferase LarE [Prolixibacteraceae bacterium JC049]|nr:ATP-dependent sacrificial sulfur transferase LarE [Prolixibacteraceae bacterium JC049]
MTTLVQKEQQIVDLLQQYQKVTIAFSGGTDSTLLSYLAQKHLGNNAMAITISTPYVPQWEIQEARDLAQQIGIQHKVIQLDIPHIIQNNPADRCYLCKKELFNQIIAAARGNQCNTVMDGSNADDTSDYRPGMKALKELKVVSPLLLANITKAEVRELSRKYNLPTSEKPAYACLLTRLPFDQPISIERLESVEKAEVYLHQLGYKAVRVRTHDNVARIELPLEQVKSFVQNEDIGKISHAIKEMGFQHVTIDLEGYATGSMNRQILSK